MFDIIKFGAENFILFQEIEINFKKIESNFIFINGKNLDVAGTESNGSGKSLVGDLLTDILFDATIRKHSQESLIGKFKKYSFEYIVLKDRTTKDIFKIKKYRNHPTYKNRVIFLKKKKKKLIDLSRKRKQDTYSLIWKTFGINWKTYKNSNFFGQGDTERFLNVTDAKKAEIIIDIQSLKDLQKCKDLSRKERRKLKEKEAILIESLQNKKDSIKSLLSSIKSIQEEINSEKIKVEKELIGLKRSTEKTKFDLLQMADLDPDYFSSDNERIVQIEKSLTEEDNFLKKLLILGRTFDNTTSSINFQTKELDRLSEIKSDKEKEKTEIKTLKVTTCRYCGSSLTVPKAERVMRKLDSEILNIQEKEKKCAELLKNLNHELGTITIRKKEIEKKLHKIGDISSLKKEKDDLIKKIAKWKETNQLKTALYKEIERNSFRISSLEDSLKNPSGQKTLNSLRKNIKAEKVSLDRYKINLEDLFDEIKKNEFSEQIFDKTIRYIFNNFLFDLNAYSSRYVDILCDDTISIQFSPKTEKKSKKIVDEINVAVSVNGEPSRPFRTYCGGEKRRIDLSTQLGLFSSSYSQIPFLFLDEPFHGIDKEGRERVTELLRKKAEEGVTVIIISHEDIPSFYGKILTIVREENKSFLSDI